MTGASSAPPCPSAVRSTGAARSVAVGLPGPHAPGLGRHLRPGGPTAAPRALPSIRTPARQAVADVRPGLAGHEDDRDVGTKPARSEIREQHGHAAVASRAAACATRAPRRPRPDRSGSVARRLVLAAAARAPVAPSRSPRGADCSRWAEESLWPGSRCTTHGPMRRCCASGSVGLGTSYVAGWWDADDLTALVRALFRRTRRVRERLDRLGRPAHRCSTCRPAWPPPDRADDRATFGRTTTSPTTSSSSCWTRP